MPKRQSNILWRQEIAQALNRYITSQLFEARIMEHPQQALERTTIKKGAYLCFLKNNDKMITR